MASMPTREEWDRYITERIASTIVSIEDRMVFESALASARAIACLAVYDHQGTEEFAAKAERCADAVDWLRWLRRDRWTDVDRWADDGGRSA